MDIDKLELVTAERTFVSYNFTTKLLERITELEIPPCRVKGSYGLQVINYLDQGTCSTFISCITKTSTLYDINEEYQISKTYKETI